MRRKLLIATAAIVVIGAGTYWFATRPDVAQLSVEATSGVRPKLVDPRAQTFPTVKIAQAVGWPAGAKPVAAKGLAVNAFATGLDHPRWLYRLPNGDVLVAESNSPPREGGGVTGLVMKRLMSRAGAGVPSANRITLLRDTNGDGVAEARSVLLTADNGLESPFGMVLVGETLYVANHNALIRFPFKPGVTKITGKGEKVVDLPGGGNHWTRDVIAGPEGTLLVSVGSASNIAENGLEAEKNRATILEVDPRTKRFRIFAAGLRNPIGLALHPETQRLWTVVNERDMLGSDGPPDYLTQVTIGQFFGWPWNYWGGYVDERVQPERPDLREYSARPSYSMGPHTAPLGLTFATDVKLGSAFAKGAFVGLHGSWNRVPASGYKVVFVPFGERGLPVPDAKPVDVLTGFLDAKGKAQGRPVGVTADRTGALLVADDVGNTIWRVSAPAQ
ncbi:sorbosone dehydrogenase family protein [Sphingomonas sp. R647]|uniref:PQQ-dependent sugar dehydrogenase n=1 Tax=Sphingomonas sp. R647 TaxID=2875233 RepID=UPI001CD5B917|nr:sorbosone dehydrogenase family protein [Sphingomonas sp. R647]MCA1198833.1 sorbosone dehydrogenase family protein [Sphingomonas sp. R647]